MGTPELSAYDMASAYTAFANKTNPHLYVTHITDKMVEPFTAIPEQKAINPSYNYVIVDMLKYVAEVIGKKYKSEIAGKDRHHQQL